MSSKWTGNSNELGILRKKSEFKDKKEELFVFGYSCKLFRDDEKALHIDQGKHLIPWMGDESLKIDRYDARGALHEVSRLEAPSGGYDWHVELTRAERDVEQLCDEERYRALHTNEDEEEMYKEEELKRLHAAGYGQVGFNYDAPPPAPPPPEQDEPFVPEPHYRSLFAPDIPFPDTEKLNAIIEKTAKFIASQGAQMEILIKAKQGDNPQFQFLNRDCELHRYYMALIQLIRAGRWPEKRTDAAEEKPHEHEEYLHPSLASAVIESAPSIPSIQYRPSADCDYTLLITKMRGGEAGEGPEEGEPALAPGELAPPGTRPLPQRPPADIARAPVMYHQQHAAHEPVPPVAPPLAPPLAAPVPPPLYAAYYHHYMAQAAAQQAVVDNTPSPPPPAPAAPAPSRSTGLSLMKNYNTDSGSDISDCDDSSSTEGGDKDTDTKPTKDTINNKINPKVPSKGTRENKISAKEDAPSAVAPKTTQEQAPNVVLPPEDIQLVIDKMAAYVARNGAEFAEIVRARGDPRFMFLEPTDVYHGYYREMLREKRGEGKARIPKPPLSFSIKKLKEPEPVLPKPALPYESSSDEEGDKDKQTDKQTDNTDKPTDNKDAPKINSAPTTTINSNNVPVLNKADIPQVIPNIKAVETPKSIPNHTSVISEVKSSKKDNTSVQAPPTKYPPKVETKKSPDIVSNKEKYAEKESPKKEIKKSKYKKEHKEKSKTRRDKRDGKEKKREKDKDKNKEKESSKGKDKSKSLNDDLESEIISLDDNDDVCIDLTEEDPFETKDGATEACSSRELEKQAERRRRAAEFLRRVGVDPGAPLPASSLASAMVDTLQSMRKKKEEEEVKRRKREKRRHREEESKSHRKSKRRKHRSSDEEDESDNDRDNSSKKKKRKKDKKSSKSKKKKTKETEPEAEQEVLDETSLNIDLSTTLKGLRTSSPTKEIVLQDVEGSQHSFAKDSSSSEDADEEEGEETEPKSKKKKEDREYSEGEWSSDSEKDSESVPSKNGE